MTGRHRGRCLLIGMAICLLDACSTSGWDDDSGPALPSAEDTMNQCLAQAAPHARPLADTGHLSLNLSRQEWSRYVGCTLARNMRVARDSVADNPEATVSIHLAADGAVTSIDLPQSSGNPAWDKAVQRAIAAASPLPRAPATLQASRVDMQFRPHPEATGIGGSTGLTAESHWTVRHCTTVGGVSACN